MAIHDFKSQRLYVTPDLVSGNSFDASREQANYLLNVLRMRNGDEVLVFNGRHGEWLTRLEAIGRKKCALIPIEQVREQPEPSNLTYCFAPLKQARLDYMVQKAVEMGVGTLQPVITRHTQVRSVNQKRVLANVIEAAEQCGIISLPEIAETIILDNLHQVLGSDTLLVFCDEAAPGESGLDEISPNFAARIAVLIGPEGGFSKEERQTIMSLPNVKLLGLGPRILRADTAAVAALSLIQAKLGDWYCDP